MAQLEISIELTMQNYIAHPFWPARNLCIDIEKKSGVNRQKSEEKRRAALEAECGKRDMSYDDYLAAREQAAEQWYRENGPGSAIVIPRHQLAGALVQTIAGAPKALRGPFDKDNFRAFVQLGDFLTDRERSDGTFSRFVKLEGSNQRSWQENDYIGRYLDKGEAFQAEGVVTIADDKTAATVKALLEKAVQSIGLGAARKMGFGRGLVVAWKAAKG